MKQDREQSTRPADASTIGQTCVLRTLSADEVSVVAGGEVSVDEYPLPKR